MNIVPLAGIGEVAEGSDLPAILGEAIDRANLALVADDILVVTQKIVSKAEGRYRLLTDIRPSEDAKHLAAAVRKDPRLVHLVLAESTNVVRAAPNVLVTRHRLGLVMANAGIDRSNIGPGDEERVLLLPEDPDASAERIARGIEERLGTRPRVLISDSFGRPWRYGVVGVAIGAAGCPSLVDRRGEADRDGRTLEVTQVALGDLVASAALLVTGEGAEGIPAVLVRGVPLDGPERAATALVRPVEEDLFR